MPPLRAGKGGSFESPQMECPKAPDSPDSPDSRCWITMDHRAGMDCAYPMHCSPALESMGEPVKKIQRDCMSGMT